MVKFMLGLLLGLVVGVCVGRDDVRSWMLGQATARSAMASKAIADQVKR
jgi:hypothetical protein